MCIFPGFICYDQLSIMLMTFAVGIFNPPPWQEMRGAELKKKDLHRG
jgi:hypothetical protein